MWSWSPLFIFGRIMLLSGGLAQASASDRPGLPPGNRIDSTTVGVPVREGVFQGRVRAPAIKGRAAGPPYQSGNAKNAAAPIRGHANLSAASFSREPAMSVSAQKVRGDNPAFFFFVFFVLFCGSAPFSAPGPRHFFFAGRRSGRHGGRRRPANIAAGPPNTIASRDRPGGFPTNQIPPQGFGRVVWRSTAKRLADAPRAIDEKKERFFLAFDTGAGGARPGTPFAFRRRGRCLLASSSSEALASTHSRSVRSSGSWSGSETELPAGHGDLFGLIRGCRGGVCTRP